MTFQYHDGSIRTTKKTSKQRAIESYVSSQWWILTGARSQLGAYNISKGTKMVEVV